MLCSRNYWLVFTATWVICLIPSGAPSQTTNWAAPSLNSLIRACAVSFLVMSPTICINPGKAAIACRSTATIFTFDTSELGCDLLTIIVHNYQGVYWGQIEAKISCLLELNLRSSNISYYDFCNWLMSICTKDWKIISIPSCQIKNSVTYWMYEGLMIHDLRFSQWYCWRVKSSGVQRLLAPYSPNNTVSHPRRFESSGVNDVRQTEIPLFYIIHTVHIVTIIISTNKCT